ncbi:phosphorylase family protein [Pseudomonas chlororaphis]|uniref:phosphorylase family protein n=1 Tax=Pseudomonas chlororaphis TaxID=587753 RepID=UPI000F54D6BF|nr:5'-methylthioadenosine phosphorylase [Pseudomonas chlororaphis]AZD46177.1 5'-methylthioadenosine phosphorylase [Pseudomonas chlororaphis subsp. aurantiaca]
MKILLGLLLGCLSVTAWAATPAVPCKADIAVIGGTFINDAMLKSGKLKEFFTLETPAGTSPTIYCGNYKNVPFYYINMHGDGKIVETWAALYQLRVKDAIGGATAGGINPAMKLHDLVVADDVIDFNIDRPLALPDAIYRKGDHPVPRYTPAMDPILRDILIDETQKRLNRGDAPVAGINLHKSGVIMQTRGGRFETAAEVRMLAKMGGDLVTMSVGSEVIYARMAGINYASLIAISNPAEGLGNWTWDTIREVYPRLNPVCLEIVLESLPKIAAIGNKPRVGDSLRIHPEMTSEKK